MRRVEKGEKRDCACGCRRTVPKGRNRNKVERRFYSDECRAAYDRKVRKAGSEVVEMRPVRRQRQESLDLDRMTSQDRVNALAAAYWRSLRLYPGKGQSVSRRGAEGAEEGGKK